MVPRLADISEGACISMETRKRMSMSATNVIEASTNVPNGGAVASSNGLVFSIALVVLVLSVVGVALAKRKKHTSLSREVDVCIQPQPISQSPIGENPDSAPIPEWPSPHMMTGEGISQEWREFVAERLNELDPRQNIDETKWALGVVDFLDELKESELEAFSAERAISTSLHHELLDVLSSKGFAVVESEAWNPDLQRAVAVVRKPDATETKILGKGATGLARNGKIIRKQEVKIEMKGN